MSLTLARRAALAALFAGIALGVACTSDPSGSSSLCSAAQSASRKCKDPSPCDSALTAQCTNLDKAVSPSAISAAKDCLESGVCGAANCLAHGPKAAKPTEAHLRLAETFCSSCAPDVSDCTTRFYDKKGKLPGVLVLPYAESVVAAVEQACTGDLDTCRASFATCATDTIARVVGETVDAELAECVLSAFRGDEGTNTAPGGGPQLTKCTVENCKGCCRDDQCEDGASETACGARAGACEVCNGGQKCTGGRCKEPCGPNNCSGCCDGEICRPGTVTEKCGSDGEACRACAATDAGFICSNKTCIDSSCQVSCVSGCCTAQGCQPGTAANACGVGGEACIDCGYGRVCNASRSCAIDPNALWDVYVSFGTVPSVNTSGSTWDPLSGAPDPYLIAYSSQGASSHTGQTAVVTDATVPVWVETPLVGVKAGELLNKLAFEVWDSDVDFDDLIGGCTIPLTAAMFDGSLQSHVCPATASSASVELYFRLNPHR